MIATVQVDPLTEFFDGIRSPITRDRYGKQLDIFLRHIGVVGMDLKEEARSFAAKAYSDTQWATYVITEYVSYQKMRAEKGEIS